VELDPIDRATPGAVTIEYDVEGLTELSILEGVVADKLNPEALSIIPLSATLFKLSAVGRADEDSDVISRCLIVEAEHCDSLVAVSSALHVFAGGIPYLSTLTHFLMPLQYTHPVRAAHLAQSVIPSHGQNPGITIFLSVGH